MEQSSEIESQNIPPLYRVEPDYSRPVLAIPKKVERRIRRRLSVLYGQDRVDEIYPEFERILKVHNAFKTDEIQDFEYRFDTAERFNEKDIILITYGDLILSSNRRPLETLADFTEVFFKGLITTIHILPFYPYSSDRGFSVESFRTVDPKLGDWDDIAHLKRSFRLMFDGVVNHISSKSRWFREFLAGNKEFQDYFIVFNSRDELDEEFRGIILRPRTTELLSEFQTLKGPKYVWTTFSPDQIDLNYKNPAVLLNIFDVLLNYVRRGADLLRLDAVTYLWHEVGTSCAHLRQTHEIIRLLRDVLDLVAPHVAIVTETNVPHADNIVYFGDGRNEAQLVYNFALPPLVLDCFQRQDSTCLTNWAKDLDPPSETTAFLNFLDSHDGIGVMGARGILSEEQIQSICECVKEYGGYVSMKANGDGTESPYELNITWFSALNREDSDEDLELQISRYSASRAIPLFLRGVPAIYLPSMFGSRNDLEAVSRKGTLRDINRSEFREDLLLRTMGDTNSIAFQTAKSLTKLMMVRESDDAFHPNSKQRVLELSPSLFSLIRVSKSDGHQVLCIVNVTAAELSIELDRGLPGEGFGELTDMFSREVLKPEGNKVRVTFSPYQVRMLKASASSLLPDKQK